jgi:hypothetical protein
MLLPSPFSNPIMAQVKEKFPSPIRSILCPGLVKTVKAVWAGPQLLLFADFACVKITAAQQLVHFSLLTRKQHNTTRHHHPWGQGDLCTTTAVQYWILGHVVEKYG